MSILSIYRENIEQERSKKVLKGSHITSRFCQKEVEKTGSLSIEQ
jgi:hypothetical protein